MWGLRLKVISDCTDRGLHKLVRIYEKVQLAELVASIPLRHCYFSLVWSRSLKCSRSWTTCLSSRVCFSESLKQSCLHFPLSGFHACIFFSQVFMPAFSSLGFSLPVRLLILLKMMLRSTALSRLSVTEHWRKQHGEG